MGRFVYYYYANNFSISNLVSWSLSSTVERLLIIVVFLCLFPGKCQAFYWSWGCSYDTHGISFIHASWSKIAYSRTSLFVLFLAFLSLIFGMINPIWYCPWNYLQLFYLSGILTVFFCGIVMSHYTWHNVTESSRVTTKYVNFLNCYGEQLGYLGLKFVLSKETLAKLPCVTKFLLPTVAGMLLPLCLLLPRSLSFFMLAWMLWTLKSGGL